MVKAPMSEAKEDTEMVFKVSVRLLVQRVMSCKAACHAANLRRGVRSGAVVVGTSP